MHAEKIEMERIYMETSRDILFCRTSASGQRQSVEDICGENAYDDRTTIYIYRCYTMMTMAKMVTRTRVHIHFIEYLFFFLSVLAGWLLLLLLHSTAANEHRMHGEPRTAMR